MSQERQLDDKEKDQVLRKHGRVCFVSGHSIGQEEKIEFHHIKPYAHGGPTSVDNIAPVCHDHHRHIGTLSLTEYRDKLEMEKFFDRERKLDDILEYKVKQYGKPTKLTFDGQTAEITYFDGSHEKLPVYEDPATGWKFTHSFVPAHSLSNDIELQPRPLEGSRLWDLYTHLRSNAQLAASVARFDEEKGRILLFDGQHKAAAQLWLGRRAVECKVYLNANPRMLKETNLMAHYKLRQMPFYTSTLIRKYGNIFGEDWQEYAGDPGVKSEAGFVEFLMSKGKKRAEANRELRSAIYRDVLESTDPPNMLTPYIEEENRARKNPLSINLVQRTFFQEFLVDPPVDAEFEGPNDFRVQERRNLIRLLNMIVEVSLDGKWNPDANDANHKMASRVYLSGAVRAWAPMLKDVVAQVLRLFDSDDREKVFFRAIGEEDFKIIRGRIARLFSHKIWLDPDPTIDAQLKINEPILTKQFLSTKGLTASWILGSGS